MRILYVTTISLTMNCFFKPHLQMLVEQGHQVDIACNYSELPLAEQFHQLGCGIFQVDFSRSPLSGQNVKAYRQLKALVAKGNYDLVHCHTPNAAAVTRLVCRQLRKRGLKVYYTAHGFHFYKGAPLLNWLMFYPVERLCARWTDVLITVNREDEALARRKLKAKQILYVPGVGIDLDAFAGESVDAAAKRRQIGVPEQSFLLLSVGELNENKNHETVIRALGMIDRPEVHYAVAGDGVKRDRLLEIAREAGVADQVHLLGYRNDVRELYACADVFVFPSFREGLSASVMEAMASGKAVVCSRIRGNTDLIDENGGVHFAPDQVRDCARVLRQVLDMDIAGMGSYNREKIEQFSLCRVLQQMQAIYEGGAAQK